MGKQISHSAVEGGFLECLKYVILFRYIYMYFVYLFYILCIYLYDLFMFVMFY